MKIYTKTGDEGKTSLFDNSRVWKSDERIMSYGAVDELNSSIGIALSLELDNEIKEILIKLQNDLFIVGSDLANPNMANKKIRTTEEMIIFLEQKIDLLEPQLKPLTSFILPGGTLLASILHLSRTISRRAETHVVELSKSEDINKKAVIYLNRLSDLMFILARIVNNRKKMPDIIWKS
ncbi:cob(I)yrinic acid a,c-diamide adenosyltransferase [Candidatus Nitrosopelagicus sp.]|nr:cob(I)yrinic acid a,c-diamide adenosyltransferase [Candidatus Nitrosopelagicus sp.]